MLWFCGDIGLGGCDGIIIRYGCFVCGNGNVKFVDVYWVDFDL